jgi:hypothetical protein
MHRPIRQHPRSLDSRPEEGAFLLTVDIGRIKIFIQILFELVVRRHLVDLATFLVQPHPPALAIGKVVLNLHAKPRR